MVDSLIMHLIYLFHILLYKIVIVIYKNTFFKFAFIVSNLCLSVFLFLALTQLQLLLLTTIVRYDLWVMTYVL